MTPIEIKKQQLRELIESRNQATPDSYESRVREFSNHAPSEIWTHMGWYRELPLSYREPTTDLLVLAANNIEKLSQDLLVALETLEKSYISIKNQSRLNEVDPTTLSMMLIHLHHVAKDALQTICGEGGGE